jgi:hypothetical protein
MFFITYVSVRWLCEVFGFVTGLVLCGLAWLVLAPLSLPLELQAQRHTEPIIENGDHELPDVLLDELSPALPFTGASCGHISQSKPLTAAASVVPSR